MTDDESAQYYTTAHLENLCTILVSNPVGSFTEVNRKVIRDHELWIYFTPRWSGEYIIKIFERQEGDRYNDENVLLNEVPVIIQDNIQNECFATVPIKLSQNSLTFPNRTQTNTGDKFIVRVLSPLGHLIPGQVTVLEGDEIKIDFEPECTGEYEADVFDQEGNLVTTIPVVID